MTETMNPRRIEPLHEVTDAGKLFALNASMTERGWVGAPIVILERGDSDPLAVTGTHRLAAATEVGIDVPTVDLVEILAEHGADFDALVGEFEEAGLDIDDARYEVIRRLPDYLPADVCDMYGLDAH